MKRSVAILFNVAMTFCLAFAPAASRAIDREHNRKLWAAFADVVKAPSKSTVQVYCDGYRAALGAIVRSDGYIVTKASELKGKLQCELRDSAGKLDATSSAPIRPPTWPF
jgi:hypothetical protein